METVIFIILGLILFLILALAYCVIIISSKISEEEDKIFQKELKEREDKWNQH